MLMSGRVESCKGRSVKGFTHLRFHAYSLIRIHALTLIRIHASTLLLFSAFTLILFHPSTTLAAEVKNTVAKQAGNRILFEFDVAGDAGEETDVNVTITVEGKTYTADKLHLEGDFGKVKAGKGKKVWWNILQDFPRGLSANIDWEITAGRKGKAHADGKSLYMANCVGCHGDKGQGSPVGPAQKGNEFITKGKADDIKKVILEGRTGKAKKYPKIPGDMLPWKGKISDKDIDDLVKFLQTDLQK